MAELYVNVNGTWKQASNYYVNVNGTWKEGSELHAKVSSAWKQSGSAVYSGTSGIVTTNIVLDLNATLTNSYSGSGTTWSNLASSSLNATLVNGVTFSSDNGGTFVFDGTNDYAEITSASALGGFSGDFTIEFWYKASDQGGYDTLFDFNGQNSSTGLLWAVQSANPTGSNMAFRRDGTFAITTSGIDAFDDNWHHHVIARNGSTITYYIDNVSRGTVTYSSSISSGTHLKIGGYSIAGGYEIAGSLPQVRIYDGTGFTASQVLQNYNATKSNYFDFITTNLVLYLDASNASSYAGSGTTWNDISGGDNDLTLTNGPTFNSQDGGVIVFDGTNDSAISALNQAFFQFGTGDYSYGLWVKFDTLGDYEAPLSSGRGGEQGTNDYIGSWQIDYGGGNTKINHKLGSSSGNIVLNTSLTPSTGTWYYLFVVNDRSENELKLYVNGSLNTTSSNSGYGSISVGNYSNTTSIYNVFNVGRNRNQDAFLDGSVGQVHVYKGKALSASEVLQNYNATKGKFLGAISTTNLVFYVDAGKSMSYSGSGTTWTDLSSSSYNGTLTNGPTFDSDFGGSIVFDGTDDYVQFSSDMFNPNSDFTISAWVNLDTASGTNNYTIISNVDATGSIQLRYKNGSGVQIIDNNIVQVGTFTSSTLSITTWHNVTVTRSSNTYTLYLNGSSTSSFTSSNTYDGGARSIGINRYNSEKWDGKIAQVFAYSSALSASDVLSNYNATKDTFGYATVSDPSGIIATGLDILLDAGNSNSYSGSGTTWTNLAPSTTPFSNATLSSATGTNTYSSSNSGYFDECRAFISIGSSITYPTMTYSVWCYPDNLGGYQTLVDQGNDNWYFGFQGTTLITYDPNTSTGSGVVANNNWYNLTMTHTQNDVVKFYINGIKHSQTEGTYNTAPTFSQWNFGGAPVGTSSAGNERFEGYIAAIAVYNRALSATEVLQNHNALKSRFGL